MTGPHNCTQCYYRDSTFSGSVESTASCDHPELGGRDLTPNEPLAPDWCPLGLAQPVKQRLLNLPENPTIHQPTLAAQEEQASPYIPLQVTHLFEVRWEAASKEFTCHRCSSPLERTRGLMLTSPWSGSVRCTKCEYKDSVMGYLGKSMIQVQPMPPGAKLIYDQEPDMPEDPPDDVGSKG